VRKDKCDNMKFGYFCNPQDPGAARDWLEMMNEVRDLAVFCDDAGFDSFWLAEHHFNHRGIYILPNPVVMATDLASRTKRIRIGLGAAIITFWHPLRLAEDLAMLDQLSEGRLEIGVGRGNFGIEGVNLNSKADPRDQKANFEVFAETLEIIKRAFSQQLFSFEGKHYTFPTAGFTWDRHTVKDAEYVDPETNELRKLTIIPRTRQQPHPPIWQVVDSASSVEFAGRNDIGIIMWRPPADMLRERFRLYQDSAATVGKKRPLGSRCGITRDTFVAETKEKARELCEKYLIRFLNYHNWRGPKIYLHPGEQYSSEQEERLKSSLDYDFVQRSVLVGSPEEVIDRIEELREVSGVEQILINSSWEGIPHELTMRSMKLFADKVLPKVQGTTSSAGLGTAAE